MDYTGRGRRNNPDQRFSNHSSNKNNIRLAVDYNGALPQIDRRRNGLSPKRHTRTTVGYSGVDDALLSKLKREFEIERRNGYHGNPGTNRVDRFGRKLKYPEGYTEDVFYKPALDTTGGNQRYYNQSERNGYNGVIHSGTKSINFENLHEIDNRKSEELYGSQKHRRSHNDLKHETETRKEKRTETKEEQKKEAAQKPSFIRVTNLIEKSQLTDNLNKKANEVVSCGHRCTGSLMTTLTSDTGPRKKTEIIEQAINFFDQYYSNLKCKDSPEHVARLKEVQTSVEKNGTYDLLYDELVFGTKTAWRNAPRCIGRIQWSNLEVFDARKVRTAREMFDAICRHIKYASNKGNIRSAVTVFRQRLGDRRRDFRVYNQQVIAYAGYRQPNGSIRGDPAYADFTTFCQSIGWKGKGGRFDVLPIVVQADGRDPEWFEIPPELVMEVRIVHPKFPSFADLGLKWFGLPAVASMMLDCGGIQFTACPFSGWYMSTEVACRDFCDEQRYNLVEEIADKLGLDKSNNISLWKDKAVVETNIAVLHSFQLSGITIMDHHTASESFMTFMQNEHKQRGGCPADWVWIVPPMSGSLCPVFHQEMALYKLRPSYEYQDEVWRTYATRKDREKRGRKQKLTFRIVSKAAFFSSILMTAANSKRVKCTILFATETGKSEKFASTLYKIFKQTFNARLMNMENYNLAELPREQLLLFVASTFGNGHPPENGRGFSNGLTAEKDRVQKKSNRHDYQSSSIQHAKSQVLNGLSNVKFSAFGLGSRAYPYFCAFAHFLDDTMNSLGAKRIYSLGEGDELSGQEESFRTWAKNVFGASCVSYNIKDNEGQKGAAAMLDNSDMTWKPGRFRIAPVSTHRNISITEELTRIHRKNVVTCRLKDRTRFEMSSGRLTILAKIDMRGNESKLDYNPGDHVLLFPSNPARLVEELLQYVKNVPDVDKPVKVEQRFIDSETDKNANSETWQVYFRLPQCSLRDILTSYIDITTPPSQDLLKDLSEMVSTADDQKRLRQLASTTNAYDQWKAAKMPTLVDVLRQFPSIRLPADYLIVRLPLLQPRYYSISSSLDASSGEIHVTADVVKYQTPDGQTHRGLCSNWLNDVRVGQDLLCAVKSAPLFHMPSSKTTPIIMVGPGTGIAPFRSFWMQRKVDMRKRRGNYGPMILYFGCRNSTTDNFYKNEITQCEFEGVMSKCYFAYSREPGARKTYVQDLIKQNGKEVFQLIVHGNGHFYICGNIQMASDVKNTLLSVIQRHGNMTDYQSDAYLNKMKAEDRLHEDIFGLAVKKQ